MRGVRLYLIGVALTALAACGVVAREDAALGQALASFGEQEVDPRFVALLRAERPALQLGFVGRPEDSSTLLLEQRRDGFEYWLSPDGVQFIFKRGMLHGTRGLGDGLLASDLGPSEDLVLGLRSGNADRLHTYLTGNDQAITRTFRCVIRTGDVQQIELNSGFVQTRRVRESCASLDHSFDNIYWIDLNTRDIVQSRQWAGPFTEAFSTRVVRP